MLINDHEKLLTNEQKTEIDNILKDPYEDKYGNLIEILN